MKHLLWMAAILFGGQVDCAALGGGVAVVDLKKVASQSLIGQDIDKQIEAANNEAAKGIKDLEEKIKSMESNKKSDYDSRKIEDMQVIMYDMVRTKKYQISEAYRKAVAVLDSDIKSVIQEICVEKNIEMVMVSDAVVYLSSKCPDISDEVINRLNEAKKWIKVEIKELK